MTVVSAHAAASTRLCVAENCPYDAQGHSRLCGACQRKLQRHGPNSVRIHQIEQPAALENTLRCEVCDEWKPDEAFTPARNRAYRRYRHQECKECHNARRRRERAEHPIAKCAGITMNYPKGKPCGQYVVTGSAYCWRHTDQGNT